MPEGRVRATPAWPSTQSRRHISRPRDGKCWLASTAVCAVPSWRCQCGPQNLPAAMSRPAAANAATCRGFPSMPHAAGLAKPLLGGGAALSLGSEFSQSLSAAKLHRAPGVAFALQGFRNQLPHERQPAQGGVQQQQRKYGERTPRRRHAAADEGHRRPGRPRDRRHCHDPPAT